MSYTSKEIYTVFNTDIFSRYGNIWPYDGNRVKLRTHGDSDDYINASWINNGGTIKFIAAQGPLPTTVPEFLRMIAENKVTTIVGLTKLIEKDANGMHLSLSVYFENFDMHNLYLL